MTNFTELEDYLRRVPAIVGSIGTGVDDAGSWWFKFAVDIDHELPWNVVQEFRHVLNYVPLEERLPTVFKPVSPPPYMNGGPQDFLSWVIECRDSGFAPSKCAEWLEGRLPRPVEDLSAWQEDEDNEE